MDMPMDYKGYAAFDYPLENRLILTRFCVDVFMVLIGFMIWDVQ